MRPSCSEVLSGGGSSAGRRHDARLAAAAAACQALILDEAHRLKSRQSATRGALLELPVRWKLLLTGTPVQNNMSELQVRAGVRACMALHGCSCARNHLHALPAACSTSQHRPRCCRSLCQGLMSLLDEQAYGNADRFMATYGNDTPSLEQIQALQVGAARLALRRVLPGPAPAHLRAHTSSHSGPAAARR